MSSAQISIWPPLSDTILGRSRSIPVAAQCGSSVYQLAACGACACYQQMGRRRITATMRRRHLMECESLRPQCGASDAGLRVLLLAFRSLGGSGPTTTGHRGSVPDDEGAWTYRRPFVSPFSTRLSRPCVLKNRSQLRLLRLILATWRQRRLSVISTPSAKILLSSTSHWGLHLVEHVNAALEHDIPRLGGEEPTTGVVQPLHVLTTALCWAV